MGPVAIARLTEAEWEVFASLRLHALAEAFGRQDEQYLFEQRFTSHQWRRRLAEHAQFAARLAGRPVGLIGAHRETADTVYLYSLWLDPPVRGHGLARRLITAALDWARAADARVVYLRVAADNASARAVYARLGFTPVVDTEAMAGEVAMAITVGQGGSAPPARGRRPSP